MLQWSQNNRNCPLYICCVDLLCGFAVCDLYVGLICLSFVRFCDLVNSITEEAWKGPEEGDCDAEALEVRAKSITFPTSTVKQLFFSRNNSPACSCTLLCYILLCLCGALCLLFKCHRKSDVIVVFPSKELNCWQQQKNHSKPSLNITLIGLGRVPV